MPPIPVKAFLGKTQSLIESAMQELNGKRIPERIWNHDHTVWKPEPTEIANRLGWLRVAENMMPVVPQINQFVESLRSDGYTQALLLGMGGSSLAPEVFRKTFGVAIDYLDLAIMDSTDPAVVKYHAEHLDFSKTLFIVSTKSGGTVETLSFFKFFYNQVAAALGSDSAGTHFIAITDPGSKLASIAQTFGFREIFLNDPNIGGRFSALSYFGLVPAALLGVDIRRLLESGIEMGSRYEEGVLLGTIMGVLAKESRDKITWVISEPIKSFGDWVEQLIAESTGKEGVGILPIVNESLGKPEIYGHDRLFVQVKFKDDLCCQPELEAIKADGNPLVEIHVDDLHDLGGLMFLWEFATSIAGYFLKINPFDQPNVESAKVLARKMVTAFMEHGSLPASKSARPTPEILHSFLEQSKPGDYIALQAYLPPTEETQTLLQEFRVQLRSRYKLGTTLGYGPRYLHSTGQLHKGDSGNGLFIQFISDPLEDIGIPDEAGKPGSSISFGTLELAQALGDGDALQNGGRRFIRLNLGSEVNENLRKLISSMGHPQ